MQERGPVEALTSARLALGAGTAGAVVAVDQLTKSWALRALDDGPVHVVWTLRFKLSFNSGAAFGLGQGLAPLFMVVAIAVLVVLVGFGRGAATTPVAAVALGLVAGGAAGNLADRFLRDHGGAVVDFIDLRWWPVFNVADAALSVGALAFVLSARTRTDPVGVGTAS
ncbi:MAG TPA: signal peptidase II [Acidimicrobiales bacterium]|nr:signal peptidase II [Acidimicrobiales bacterium]